MREPESSSDKSMSAREVALCHLELPGGYPLCAEMVELGVEQVEHLVGVLGRRADRDGERARRRRRRAGRTRSSSKAPRLADLLEEPAGQAAAEHVVEHGQREALGRVPVRGAHAEHELGLLGVARLRRRAGPSSMRAPRAPGRRLRGGRRSGLDAGHEPRRGRGRRRRRRPCCPAGSGPRRTTGSPATVTDSMTSARRGPRGRAGGRGTWHRRSSSWTTSAGSSRCMRTSSRITWRSASSSSGRSAGRHMMSHRMSRPELDVLGQQPDVEGRVLLGRVGVHVAPDLVDLLGDLAAPCGRACP